MSEHNSILIASIPIPGHVTPATSIARTLVERGHTVRWYCGRAFRTAIEATGARFEPMVEAQDPDGIPLDVRFPDRVGLEGLASLKFDLKHLFLDNVPGQVRDLQRILSAEPADVLLADTAFSAAATLHELGGPPFATYGISVLPIASRHLPPIGSGRPPSATTLGRLRDRVLGRLGPFVMRDVQQHHQRVRAQLGLPPTSTTVFDTMVSPYLFLQGCSPSFEYPRRDLPPQVHFIGPLLPAPPTEAHQPEWWNRLDGNRPVVLVTQGTVAVDPDDLIAPALTGLAGDHLMVIATGGSIDRAQGISIPDNAHHEPFVPFGALMPHVDVMVTNGGYGGVQMALSHGVPLVVAGTTEDKPEIAARVAWSGAGINLTVKRPTPEQIRRAVRTVLDDARYHRNAERIRADIATADAPTAAAELLERLAQTGAPLRTDEPMPA